MADYILIHNDKVKILDAFQGAKVTAPPGNIKGTGGATLGGKKLCVAGDEKSVEIKNCVYTTPVHTIPGKGTVKIKALASDQQAKKTQTSGKKVLLLGKFFDAVLEVEMAAKEPPKGAAPPVDDPLTQYMGKGNFETTNKKYKGA